MDSTEEFVREGIDRFTEGAHVPAGLAGNAVRRHRRRRAALRSGLGSGAAAVAAVAVIASTWGGGSPAPAGVQTTAYVVAQVSRAVSAPGLRNLVEEVSVPAQVAQPSKGMHFTVYAANTWEYRGLSRANVYGSDGKLNEMMWGRSSVTVSEPLRVWSVIPVQQWADLPGANGCIRPGHRRSGNLFFPTASFVRETLRCGGLVVAGHLRIGGEQTIRLVSTDWATMVSPMTLYVSPKTYLPVRIVESGITANIQWLLPTPATLALLKTHIPAGFRRVPASAFIPSGVSVLGLPNGTFAIAQPIQQQAG